METEKRKVILTLSKVFPADHPKAGELTGFESKLKAGVKRHTIRRNANNVWDRWCHDIRTGKKFLSIREWTGRPYNSEQREFARLESIGLQRIEMIYGSDDAYPQVWVDDRRVGIEEVAANDGLSVPDFVDWFFGKNNRENTFEGVVIHFTDFRY